MKKTKSFIYVSGITSRMKYWHNLGDWSKFYNAKTGYVSNLNKKVKDYKKYAETMFYEA